MGKVITFPGKETKVHSLLSKGLESEISNFPPELSDCFRNFTLELTSLSIVKKKSFELVVSDNLSEEELTKIKDGVDKIISSYRNDIVPVLKRLVEKEAELCILKYQ